MSEKLDAIHLNEFIAQEQVEISMYLNVWESVSD